ncbi:MAG: DUF983 domain-containing protein [Gemmatimonadota bacterium]
MTPERWPMPPRRTLFRRALRHRCPRCGGGPLFRHWIQMADHCPVCGLSFTRGESGYQLGAMWFNLLLAEAVSVGVFLTTVVLTWPNPPWDRLQIMGPLEAIISPLFFYPFSKTLFLAFDLAIRPVGSLIETGDH